MAGRCLNWWGVPPNLAYAKIEGGSKLAGGVKIGRGSPQIWRMPKLRGGQNWQGVSKLAGGPPKFEGGGMPFKGAIIIIPPPPNFFTILKFSSE